MQVGIDVKCMHTNFGGCSLSSFRDIATLKKAKKIESNKISSKNSCKQGLMSNICTPILVGMAYQMLPVSLSVHAVKK